MYYNPYLEKIYIDKIQRLRSVRVFLVEVMNKLGIDEHKHRNITVEGKPT